MIEPCYTVAEVATLLRFTPKWVRAMIRAGRLRALKIGTEKQSRVRIPESAVQDLIGAPAKRTPKHDPAKTDRALRAIGLDPTKMTGRECL